MKYATATLFLATALLVTGILPTLVVVSPNVALAQQKLVPCEGPDDCKFDQLVELGRRVVEFMFILASAIAVIVIAYAGFLYMTAAGNASKISKAHELIWYAVIGFMVALSAWLLIEVLLNTLTVDPQFKPREFN